MASSSLHVSRSQSDKLLSDRGSLNISLGFMFFVISICIEDSFIDSDIKVEYFMCRGPRPCSRSNHIAALYNDKMLFVFGGASKSSTLNDLYSLDFEAVCIQSLFYVLSKHSEITINQIF